MEIKSGAWKVRARRGATVALHLLTDLVILTQTPPVQKDLVSKMKWRGSMIFVVWLFGCDCCTADFFQTPVPLYLDFHIQCSTLIIHTCLMCLFWDCWTMQIHLTWWLNRYSTWVLKLWGFFMFFFFSIQLSEHQFTLPGRLRSETLKRKSLRWKRKLVVDKFYHKGSFL